MVEAARLGQLSTVRQLLDGGAATVDDQDEVKCVCFVCVLAVVIAYVYAINWAFTLKLAC